ncbi:hypothetical protein LAZ67_X004022 [Cordylochernes scorpioides]|uniref:Uncharacterized protein n=1 Tax=Cordylochernes scorpioides TaxID=51811 RepID=A0ABY6LX38_9ARAC|nr:hypothetical protein LAZ67_X004022 [Cordylochernes scorpioides]
MLLTHPVPSGDMEPNMNTRIRQRLVTEFLFKSGDISATTIHSKLQPVNLRTVTTDQNLALVEEIVKNNRTITTYQLVKKFQSLKEVSLNYFQILAIEIVLKMGAKTSNTRNEEINLFRPHRILPSTSF